MKRALLSIAIAAAIGGADLAAAAPCSSECRSPHLVVKPDETVRWQTPQRFRSNDLLALNARVNGRTIETWETISGCRSIGYLRGVSVRAVGCGRYAPLRFKVHNISGRPAVVRILYGSPAPERRRNTEA